MALNPKRSEGGSGGKRGHSNMEHWSPTEFVKRGARKVRRRRDHEEVASQEREDR